MRALQISEFGDPAEVLQLVDIPEPPPPSPDAATVAMEYAPIHPSDLLMIRGGSGPRPTMPVTMGSFPATLGTEGVGRVTAVGEGVTNVKVSDRVLTPFNIPSWAERVIVPAAGLFQLPDDLDGAQLSMLAINPMTASAMLSDFVSLNPGEWLIQNVANSAVGRAVISIAKDLGVRTVNIVRRPGLEDELKEIGADVVLTDEPGLEERVRQAVGETEIRLGLDAVGGDSTFALSNCLSARGTVVVYGSMGKSPAVVSTRQLIVNEVTVRGFWLVHWIETASADRSIEMQRDLLRLIASGALRTPVAGTYPISDPTAAMRQAMKGGGKVLFSIGDPA